METLRLVFILAALPVLTFAQPALPAPASNNFFERQVLGVAAPSDPTVLTQKERFQQYVMSSIGPVPILGEALGAGYGQWRNEPQEWHQGWGAYGKRFASNMAYNGIRQSITYGLSEALHEDNRYFASGRRGAWLRTRHALISTFTARKDDGSQQFSVSSVAGVVGAATFSSLWGPASWKGPGNIAGNAGVSFGLTAGFNVFREFSRDLLDRH